MANSIADLQHIFNQLGDPLLIVSEASDIVFANQALLDLFGYSSEEIFTKQLDLLIAPGLSRKHTEYVKHFIASGAPSREMMNRGSFECIDKSGNVFPAKISISNLVLNHNENYGIAIVHNISEIMRMLNESRKMANLDCLTGLYNKRYLDEITRPLSREFGTNESLGILFIDIDGFKSINDTNGHEYGDSVLKVVAMRIKRSIRAKDLAFRVGGDEFLILIRNVMDRQIIHEIASKLQNTFNEAVHIDDRGFQVKASIGLSQYPEDIKSVTEAISLADKAMYEAKKSMRGIFDFVR